jgi:hypothetical protein
MLQLLDLARENASLKRDLSRIREEAEALQRLLAGIRQTWAARTCRSQDERTDEHQGKAKKMATDYYVSLFIQVPDKGDTEGWQVEQALRDAAEEHLWQIVSLTVVPS